MNRDTIMIWRVEEETGCKGAIKIGQGNYGTVFKAVIGEHNIAVKVIDNRFKQKEISDASQKEADILHSIQHENLLHFVSYVNNSHSDFTYLITTYYPNGDLYDRITSKQYRQLDKQSKSELILNFMQGIAAGVRYLHDNFIVHRDLKIENVLLDNDDIPVICDFGSAEKLLRPDGFKLTKKVEGTPFYYSQETQMCVTLQASTYPIAKDNDIYALGSMLWLLWVEALPHNPNPNTARYSKLVALHGAHPPFHDNSVKWFPPFPPALEALIRLCWRPAFSHSKKNHYTDKWKRIKGDDKRITIETFQEKLNTKELMLFNQTINAEDERIKSNNDYSVSEQSIKMA